MSSKEAVLAKKRLKLAKLEREIKEERQATVLEHVRNAFRGKSPIFGTDMLQNIEITPNIQGFMESPLQGGDSEIRLFKITLKNGAAMVAYASRTHKHLAQPLMYIPIEASRRIGVDPILAYGQSTQRRPLKYSPEFAALLGISNDMPYADAMVIYGEFWGHLMTALALYMAYARRDGDGMPHANLFGNLFSRVISQF